MDKNEFNKACAKYMGYIRHAGLVSFEGWYDPATSSYVSDYNPYDDLNQMAEVVEKLSYANWTAFRECLYTTSNENPSIKQALRDFIIKQMKPLEGGDRE